MRNAALKITPEVDLTESLEASGPQLVRRADIAGATANLVVWTRMLVTHEEGTKRLMESIPEDVKSLHRLGGPAATPGANRAELATLAQKLKDQVLRLADLDPLLRTYAGYVLIDLNNLLSAMTISDVDYSEAIAAAEAATPERLPGSLKQWTVELHSDYLMTMVKCFGDPTHGGMQEREQLCDAVKTFSRKATATLLSDPTTRMPCRHNLLRSGHCPFRMQICQALSQTKEVGTGGRSKPS